MKFNSIASTDSKRINYSLIRWECTGSDCHRNIEAFSLRKWNVEHFQQITCKIKFIDSCKMWMRLAAYWQCLRLLDGDVVVDPSCIKHIRRAVSQTDNETNLIVECRKCRRWARAKAQSTTEISNLRRAHASNAIFTHKHAVFHLKYDFHAANTHN